VEKFDSSGHFTDIDYTISNRNTGSPSWTTGSGESLSGNFITDLDLADNYLAVATASGVSVLNLIDNTTTQSTDIFSASSVKFDTENKILYFTNGTTLYQVTDFMNDFTETSNLDLGVDINAIAMNSDYLYVATNNGVQKIDKTNLEGGSLLTIDSNNTDAETNRVTSVTYSSSSKQLIITFST